MNLPLVTHVRFNGKMVPTDSNVQALLGVLRTIPNLRTTGSCGGHAEKNSKWPDCSQPLGKWFVSFRANKATLRMLEAFAKTAGIRFGQGPRHTLSVCGVCEADTEYERRPWWGFWGSNDANEVAAKLYRYINNRKAA